MARLRIRLELNRGGMGVPLHKLASVVDEAQKFFHMLSQDVRVNLSRGQWMGFDFDHESLNFTAEFVGPVTAGQVAAFNAAFDGSTPLRRATIAQFARITEAIEEDEVVGFGLFSSDESREPDGWRCLSRRNALRIAEEMQILMGTSAEPAQDFHLPTMGDATAGARMFSERREPEAEPGQWAEHLKEIEANLSQRLTRVEARVEDHSGAIEDLRAKSAAAEDSARSLLSAVESFCTQAASQLERMSPAALPPKSPSVTPPPAKPARNWRALGTAAALSAGLILAGVLFWPSHPGERVEQKVAAASPPPASQPSEVSAPLAQPAITHLEMEASEQTWVSVTDEDGPKLEHIFEPGEVRALDLPKNAILRVGNAAGLKVRVNGKPVGPIGPHGWVRVVELKEGAFRIVPPQ
jgi:hypothetical protein